MVNLLSWLESRMCGINQRVVPHLRDLAGGARKAANSGFSYFALYTLDFALF
jgi:hypothetical protein